MFNLHVEFQKYSLFQGIPTMRTRFTSTRDLVICLNHTSNEEKAVLINDSNHFAIIDHDIVLMSKEEADRFIHSK